MATITQTVVECDSPLCRNTIAQDDLLDQMDRGVAGWWQGTVWQQNEEPQVWAACSPAHIKMAVKETYALSISDD